MLDVISRETMRLSDRYTIDSLKVSGGELMMRAALGIKEEIDVCESVAIICGGGNNGGDGLCLAYLLISEGKFPDVYIFGKRFDNEAKLYYDKISEYSNLYIIDGSEDYSKYDVVVDAIFGTGLARNVTGIYLDTVTALNATAKNVISVDIPSGLDGNCGKVMGAAVKADKTVSINTIKSGLLLGSGKDYSGRVVNKDIGIEIVGEKYRLIGDDDVAFPRRLNNSHKNTYGNVSIIAGSAKYMGAAKLAYTGSVSLMAGAGLVRLATPSEYSALLVPHVVEETLYPLPSKDGMIAFDKEALTPLLASSAIAFGMGVGDGEEIFDILEFIVESYGGRLLIDADGLNALSKDTDVLLRKKCDIVLTPHVKEMSRLIGKEVGDVMSDPIGVAKEFAAKYSVTVLLKGASSVITDGREVYISATGAPSMAKGGSGDVLSGVIAGILAGKLFDVTKSAYLGAYIAGKAGEEAMLTFGEYGALARDTARSVSFVMKRYVR